MNTDILPRQHPRLATLFKRGEARHFNDEELDAVLAEYPTLATEVAAAREIRDKDMDVINRVVKEIFAQYAYEKNHELAMAKCPRDIRYVVCYAVQSMLTRDPRWFDDVVLLWLKTILQAFDFPERQSSGSAGLLFADRTLEDKLKTLPKKSRSIFHTYYRLKQEMGKTLERSHFQAIAPYLEQAITTLCEDY